MKSASDRPYVPSNLLRRDWLRLVGRLEQVAGVEPIVYDDGAARGVRALQVRTGGGLAFTVLPDRGLDLSTAEYFGIPLTWSSPTGVTAPWYYEPQGAEWLRGFHGGLLVTCGLQNVGTPSQIGDQPQGVHGRLSHLPASSVSHEFDWDEDGGIFIIRGQVKEARVFGPNLVLTRTISARLGGSTIHVQDVVENRAARPAPLLLLYHVNLGWPLLDEGAVLSGPGSDAPEPRDAEAAAGLDTWSRVEPPAADFREQVYFHRPRPAGDGWAEASLRNDRLAGGLAFRLRFRPEQLPEFVQWKMMGEGTYVLGLEPATCRVFGYEAEREAKRVIDLQPGESRRFELQLSVGAPPDTR
jgi:hypothetical protein